MIVDGHICVASPDDQLDPFARFLKAHDRLCGWESSADLIGDMDRDGVDLGVLLEGPNECRLDFVSQFPDRLVAFAGVSLRAMHTRPEATLTQARHDIASGCLGFGQITPYREGMSVDHPAFLALAKLALELDVPIHIEATATVGEYHPGRVSTPLYDFEWLATRYPKLKLILSSWGGGLCLLEMMPELPAVMSNVYYDTTSPVDAYDVNIMLRTVPKVAFARKILYGSGSPLLSRHLDDYWRADAPREVIQAVLGGNMALLLSLGRKTARPT
jgi:predicted TIM-barrel fold metal-dependent hydrolase